MNTENLKIENDQDGVYTCSYRNGLLKLVIIDAVSYVKANIGFFSKIQVAKANRDQEWLVLPTNMMDFNGIVEYSAKLPMGDIMTYKEFVVINY